MFAQNKIGIRKYDPDPNPDLKKIGPDPRNPALVRAFIHSAEIL